MTRLGTISQLALRVLLLTVATTVVGGTAYALLLGCAESPAVVNTENRQGAEVGLAYGGGYGKAIFVVYPVIDPGVYGGSGTECYLDVPTVEGQKRVDCNTQYVVACDRDIPADRPFCTIVSEIGTDRESAYPKHKRQ
ncbi:MAG: hypothetical protein IT385_29910 [Deltaproteobacteria bacterium]|nr:hypothetical protein [Deltaproteobacteria bacterium]